MFDDLDVEVGAVEVLEYDLRVVGAEQEVLAPLASLHEGGVDRLTSARLTVDECVCHISWLLSYLLPMSPVTPVLLAKFVIFFFRIPSMKAFIIAKILFSIVYHIAGKHLFATICAFSVFFQSEHSFSEY
jgi:hypothetical protein